MDWNRGEHRRKFLLSPGSVLEDDGAVHRHEDLCLWGEWEAPSLVVHRWPTRGRLAGLPRVLHRPRLAPLPSTGIVQNSDPLVFGNAFRYSNCRQSTRYTHRPQKQQCLDLGSVVLFGSKQGGAFVLDTCLVVRSRLSYTLDDAPVVDGIVENVGFGPLRSCRADPGWERIEAAPFTLYAGATPDSPFDGMVSFAPCLPRAVAGDGFRRPPLTLAGTLLNENLAMATRLTETDPRPVYDEVVRQVRAAGLDLGVAFDAPSSTVQDGDPGASRADHTSNGSSATPSRYTKNPGIG